MLVGFLSTFGGHGPGVDETGLTGVYDFTLMWDEENGPTIQTALREQLGLRMEMKKVAVSYFGIDSAQRPSPNCGARQLFARPGQEDRDENRRAGWRGERDARHGDSFRAGALALAAGARRPKARVVGYRNPEVPLGTRMIEGISAVGTRTTMIALDGGLDHVKERWISPDLRIAVLMTESNSQWSPITYKLTNIIRGEQPRALFEVPADYKVVSAYQVRMLEINRKDR